MTTRVVYQTCDTPHGPLQVAATEAGICRVTIPGEPFEAFLAWIERLIPDADLAPAEGELDDACAAIAVFFDREPFPPLPLDLRGTPFQCAVWRAVLAIPFGETRSYADIARGIGHPLASRAVGAANAVNPLAFIVPCHRVIGADGSIKGYPGGVIDRKILLELERGEALTRRPQRR